MSLHLSKIKKTMLLIEIKLILWDQIFAGNPDVEGHK